jgi:transposase InsO family protein
VGDSSGIHWTGLKVWLLKLGVRVLHAKPGHPQARGKNERFHRTLKDEVFVMRRFRTPDRHSNTVTIACYWQRREGDPTLKWR